MSFWQNNAPRSPAPSSGWKPTARKIPLGCSAMTQAFMENLQLEGALLPELVFTRPIAQEQLDPQELKRFIESALAGAAPEEAGRKTELAGNLVNCVLMGSGKLGLPQKEAEELLGTSLLVVVHCNSVDNVAPIIPAAPCLAIVVAAMRAGLPNWSLEEVATLLKRFRIQERPRLFAALSDQIQRGSFSKSARDLVASTAFTALENISLWGGASRGRAATWARRSFLLARDFTDTALEEPGWIEDPTALGLARESQEVGLQLDRLDDHGPDESVMEQ